MYYRNRYYAPRIGRFTQPDPAGFIDGPNRYLYVGNNPVTFIDPYGLSKTADNHTEQPNGFVNFAIGMIPGYDLYAAYNDSEATAGDWAWAVGTLLPVGKVIKIVNKLDNAADASKATSTVLGGSAHTTNVAKGTTAERVLQADRVGSGLKDDVAHRAASFLSKEQLEAGKSFPLRGGDGVERTLLQMQGDLNGKNGIYEYILDPSGKVTHQRFIDGGIINGIPNQRVPKVP